MRTGRWKLEWASDGDLLVAREASTADVTAQVRSLCGWYNEDHNRRMLGHSSPLTHDEIRHHFRSMRRTGNRVFLLYRNGQVVGDADFRRLHGDTGEFAIMIGPRTIQGKGLGTRFSILLHAFAFDVLRLERVYLSIVAANDPGRRCYSKVGYVVDDSRLARVYADEDSDVAMRLDRATFTSLHAPDLPAIRMRLV